MDQALAQALAHIRADSRTGAAELAEQAADIFLKRAMLGELQTPASFRKEIVHIGRSLIESHPIMAPMVHLVNQVLWELESHTTSDTLRAGIEQVTARFKRVLIQHSQQVAEHALPLIDEGATIVTISQSGTVLAALQHAHRVRRFNVICAESRPLNEGREMAQSLAAHGINVQLIIDAAAVGAVAQARLVLVGADSLDTDGLVNKVGTRALALAARTSRVPFYTLCSSEKFVPPGFHLPPQRTFPASDIWAEAPRQVQIENVYYDRTPMHEIQGVVTEQGIMTPASIEGWLAATNLHPVLVELLVAPLQQLQSTNR